MARQRTSARGDRQKTTRVAPRADTRLKFTLYDLLGQPRAYYQVDRVEIEKPSKPSKKKTLAHSILLIDRSGSMRPHIEDLKATLIKLLTLDEYAQYNLLVTLISYSSLGDCTVHFQRRPIQEIMKRNSRELKQIERIRVTGRTCMSQAVQLAAELCRDEELTGITLHSDGYANDPSANREAKALAKLCADMKDRPIFLNTIAYTDSADFRLLSKIANSVSGSCLRAGNLKQVYDALYNTEKLLGSAVTPPVKVPLGKEYDYQVFLSHQGSKINGAAGPLRIRGLKEDHDAVVYKFRELSAAEYKKLKQVPEAQTSEAVLAFARAQLSEGAINTSKYALASTYDATLMGRHSKALTNPQVAALAEDLDTVLFQPGILQEHEVRDRVPISTRLSVLALARLLDQHKSDFVVNLEHLKSNYVRRGLRRIPGTRDDSGQLIEPALKTEFTDKGDYVPVSSFDINRNTANLNMLIARPVRLVPRGGGEPIEEVAGIKLDKLMLFESYTMIGDGELNVPSLKIRISGRELFDTLKQEGVLEVNGKPAENHDAATDYTLRLDTLPLVPPFERAIHLDGVFEDLAGIKVLSSILVAHLKEEAEPYTPEQIEALKNHYLSKNLYINFPTTTEYTDLQQALAEGSVDSRISYQIDLGNRHILNLGKLMPANKFLDRLYEVHDQSDRKVDKPTFEHFLDEGVTVRHKRLSARVKKTAVDAFMRRIFDDFLGLASTGVVRGILQRVDAADLIRLLQEKHKGQHVSRSDYVAALSDARRKLDAYAENIYQEKVSPLVFYIGSTGVLPDEMDAKARTAEQLTAKYPDLVLSKDEREGTFFEIGETIVSVYAKNEYFSR